MSLTDVSSARVCRLAFMSGIFNSHPTQIRPLQTRYGIGNPFYLNRRPGSALTSRHHDCLRRIRAPAAFNVTVAGYVLGESFAGLTRNCPPVRRDTLPYDSIRAWAK